MFGLNQKYHLRIIIFEKIYLKIVYLPSSLIRVKKYFDFKSAIRDYRT